MGEAKGSGINGNNRKNDSKKIQMHQMWLCIITLNKSLRGNIPKMRKMWMEISP